MFGNITFHFFLFHCFTISLCTHLNTFQERVSIALTQLPRAGIIGMHLHTILSYCFLKDILPLLYKNLHNNSTPVMYTTWKKQECGHLFKRWVDVEAEVLASGFSPRRLQSEGKSSFLVFKVYDSLKTTEDHLYVNI